MKLMEKYGDYLLIFFGLLWWMVYDLFEISFGSVITGIILGSILILTILMLVFSSQKTKEKW